MSKSPIKIIFGAGSFGRQGKDGSRRLLDILEEHNVKDLDTAYLYVRASNRPPAERNRRNCDADCADGGWFLA